MPNSSMLQVRTNPIDKEKASAILESLGTNLSTVTISDSDIKKDL